MPRYALYYAPRPDEALAMVARDWLGRDAETSEDFPYGIEREKLSDEITAEPRRYGFHGTLKPPFALRAGSTADELLDGVRAFAESQPLVRIPSIKLALIGGFFALVPGSSVPALHALADGCVRMFDRFRGEPSEDELARRRRTMLTERQEALLTRWGYPYVMEEFRFHLTLTGKLQPEDQAVVKPVLERLTAPFCGKPLEIRDLVVFVQDEPGGFFRVLARYPLGA